MAGVRHGVVAALTVAATDRAIRSLRDLNSRLDAAQGVVDDRLDKAEQRLGQIEELERHNVIDRLSRQPGPAAPDRRPH